MKCLCEGEKQKNCYRSPLTSHFRETSRCPGALCSNYSVLLEARCNDTAVPLCHKQTQKTITKSCQQNTINWLCVSVTGWTVTGPHSIRCWYVTIKQMNLKTFHLTLLSPDHRFIWNDWKDAGKMTRRALPSVSKFSKLSTHQATNQSQSVCLLLILALSSAHKTFCTLL